METKVCIKCNKVKSLADFYRRPQMKDGHRNECKDCEKERIRLRRVANPEKAKERSRLYRENNPENYRKSSILYRKNNPGKTKESRQLFREKNPGYNSRRTKERKALDPEFAMMIRLRHRLSNVMRAVGGKKVDKTLELIGCTPRELCKHLAVQFQPGMGWENRHLWHIDHKQPCSSFDLTDPEQQRQCFHYTNLQPLWAEDNLKKGSHR